MTNDQLRGKSGLSEPFRIADRRYQGGIGHIIVIIFQGSGLHRIKQHKIGIFKMFIDVIGYILHDRVIGYFPLTAHHNDQFLISPDFFCQPDKFLPIRQLIEIRIYRMYLIYIPKRIEYLSRSIKTEFSTGVPA